MNKKIYQQSQDCLLEDMDGEILLYQPVSAEAIQLNESSLMVWKLCDGKHSVADIITAIEELYPDQASRVSRDVNFVVGTLLRSKALERVD